MKRGPQAKIDKTCTRCQIGYKGHHSAMFCPPCQTLQLAERRARPEYIQKNASRAITRKAIRKGELKRQPCEACDRLDTEAHHEDYARPLEIVWLCSKCHADRHVHLKNKWTPKLSIADWLAEEKQDRFLGPIRDRGREIEWIIRNASAGSFNDVPDLDDLLEAAE